jgi:hypothetical protein
VPKTPRMVESIRVRVGGFVGRVDTDLEGQANRTFGETKDVEQPVDE